ncbi:sigma factor-like helix-turn-helix DNA-binding protein [Aliarcobacter butzleri]|uniref:sigma factor-like helix-turn-helix DNA-binding protein n=1 Tax=Aliarcobacter butzleri TaxID=28197 RepID=UPI0034509EFB
MSVKLVIKNKDEIKKFFIENNSDLLEEVNQFYLKIAGSVITIDGYCEEEESFICLEYPEYIIPLSFISHKYNKIITYNDLWHEETNVEIANKLNCTAENVRKIANRAIKKIKKIIDTDYKEYFYA